MLCISSVRHMPGRGYGGVHRELCAKRCVRGVSALVGVFTGEWTVCRNGLICRNGLFRRKWLFAAWTISPEWAVQQKLVLLWNGLFASMGCFVGMGIYARMCLLCPKYMLFVSKKAQSKSNFGHIEINNSIHAQKHEIFWVYR